MSSRFSKSATKRFASRVNTRCRFARRRGLGFEALEDRRVLATLWVDPNVNPPTAAIFSTIGAAVTAAHSGDTVKVVAGTYFEQVNVNKPLTLIGGQVRAVGEPTGASIVRPLIPLFGGIGFVLQANNVTVKNFTIRQETTGVQTSPLFAGFHILHNRFIDDVDGIDLNTSSAATAAMSTISRNKFTTENSGLALEAGIFSHGGLRNVTISGNTFEARHTLASIEIRGDSPSANVQIASNVIAPDAGIAVANISRSKINDNRLFVTSTNVIWLAGGVTNTEVANNSMLTLSDPVLDGIALDQALVAVPDTGNRISGNTISGYERGIVLQNASQNTVVSNAVVQSNTNGIYLNLASSNTVSSNTLADNADAGILLIGSVGNTLSKNALTDNHDGIELDGSNGNMLWGNNSLSNNGSGFFLSHSDQNTLSGNNSRLDDAGFGLSASSNNKLLSNTARKCTDDEGFEVGFMSQQNLLSGNMSDSDFSCFGDSNTLTKNTSKNGGIRVSGQFNTITMNTVSGSIGDGIYLTGASNCLVKGNMVLGNLRNGIVLDSCSGNTVSSNIVKNNQADGIQLTSATGNVISANMATDSDLNGIDVDALSTGNTISGNTAMENGDAFGGFDLLDHSLGGGTAGTANTWAGNKAKTRSPAGLL